MSWPLISYYSTPQREIRGTPIPSATQSRPVICKLNIHIIISFKIYVLTNMCTEWEKDAKILSY